MSKSPKTLREAIIYFADEQVSFDYVRTLRWPNGVSCPFCGCDEHSFLATRKVWKCKDCKKQYSVKVGTIFEDSPIKLGVWITAVWLICNAKNGVSSHEIHRALGVTQKTAWFMLHRIRKAMASGGFETHLSGDVEVDETYIGGKEENKHKDKRIPGTRGSANKTIVLGMLERDGEIVTKVVPNAKRSTLTLPIYQHVAPGSTIHSDKHSAYEELGAMTWYDHKTVDHKVQYVDGDCHTNGLENFWSLFKRCIKGTYIHVDPVHLGSYVDEQTFRFNNRKTNDAERFDRTLGEVAGKRLTYRELTGKA
jgi:transposase-like protein